MDSIVYGAYRIITSLFMCYWLKTRNNLTFLRRILKEKLPAFSSNFEMIFFNLFVDVDTNVNTTAHIKFYNQKTLKTINVIIITIFNIGDPDTQVVWSACHPFQIVAHLYRNWIRISASLKYNNWMKFAFNILRAEY